MLQKFNHHLNINFPLLKGNKILVACSGGLDSVVLSRLLKELNFNISLAHCNFTLRGKESDGDERFVIKLADKLSVPVFAKTFQTKEYASEHKVSTQMAARDLRYNWFEELLEQYSFDYLLTAHHLDDDLETFFVNLSRGTGLKGLTGIPTINNQVIRPLISFSREEIKIFAKEKNILWREDSSNSKSDYLRNKLRLEIIPKYKETNERLLQNFQQTQKYLQESQLLIDDYMILVFNLVVSETGSGLEIDIQKIKNLPNTNALLYQLLSPYGFTAWKDVSNLINAQSGKQVFSETHRLLKNREALILTETASDENLESIFISEKESILNTPINLQFERVSKLSEANENMVFVDFQKLKFPLEIRIWKDGDYFYPFGMKGKKKLSKFFKDEKLSLAEKEKMRVLCSEDVIVWVVGMRLDNRFKITEKTKEILKITYN